MGLKQQGHQAAVEGSVASVRNAGTATIPINPPVAAIARLIALVPGMGEKVARAGMVCRDRPR